MLIVKQNKPGEMTSKMMGAAIRAFMSPTCPACGIEKDTSDAFCDGCSELLTPDIRAALAEKETFIETFHPAMDRIAKSRKKA